MVRHSLLLLLAVVPLRSDVVEQGPKDSAPSGLLAGVARATITPPVGIAHLNWGSQTHLAAEGVDPLGMVATALVVSDGRQKFVMVDLDLLSVDGMESVAARAAKAIGVPAEHVRLAASHTHAGPALSLVRGPAGADLSLYKAVFDTWRQAMHDQVVGAVVEANSRLQAAHLGAIRGTGTININRRVRGRAEGPPAVGRNPDGFTDRDLLVVRIDNALGKPIAVLVNFQCHGTVLAYENRLLSPDWIGAMRKTVEEAMPGARCLFFQGAAGNQGPVEGFTGDLAVPHRLGARLGHEAAALALAIETVRREPTFEGYVESTAYQAKQHWRVKGPRDATLRFATKLVNAPPRQYTAAETAALEARVADARRKADDAEREGDAWKRYQAAARVRRLTHLLEQWKRPFNPSPIPVRLQALRIGEVAILSMPGEPFAEIGVAAKQASPFPVTFFCGYSTGEGGDYMPIDDEFELGGYEVERTPYGKGAAAAVIQGFQELTRALR